MSLIELEFVVREDPWGMTSSSSIIGQLLLSPQHPMWGKSIGEAWCGTHSQRPALIKGREKNLLEFIGQNPEAVLGERLIVTNGPSLPFLFKILTIKTPLSIQIHPNKKKATELSARFPERYLDPAEKPEIGVAITRTQLLLGFRPIEEIKRFINELPPAASFFSDELTSGTLRGIYQKLLTSSEAEIAFLNSSLSELLSRKDSLIEEEKQFVKLFSMYPSDPGVFQVFLLNLVTLNPGEGVFIPPDTIHAYLSGELLECMATSDSVIRAGLTTKERDVSSLLEVARYEPFKVTKSISTDSDFNFAPYFAPTNQFKLERLTGSISEVVKAVDSPIIYFCLRGSGRVSVSSSTIEMSPGAICLVCADKEHQLLLSGEFYRVSI